MEKKEKEEIKDTIFKKIIEVFVDGNYELKKYYQFINEKGDITEKEFRATITSFLEEVDRRTLHLNCFTEYKLPKRRTK